MFCKRCGQNLPEGTMQCPICGQSLMNAVQPGVEIKSHLVEAILVTLFCCLPLGIVAIVNASKVSNLVVTGRIAEAQEAANNADKWVKISFVVGLIINLIVFVLQVVAGFAAAA